MRSRNPIGLATCLSLVMVGNGAVEAGPPSSPQSGCTSETASVKPTVTVGDSIIFSWEPACGVAVLLIEEGSSDRWGIRTAPESWSDPEKANLITPRIRYGNAPAAATVVEQPAELVAGRSYNLILWRVLPAGSSAVCSQRRDNACMVANHRFVCSSPQCGSAHSMMDPLPVPNPSVTPVAGPTSVIPLADVTTVMPWRGGSLLISDETSLHIIDARSGSRLSTFGRAGDGRGEFREIDWISVLAGDTLVVFDSEHDRFTFVSPDFKSGKTSSYRHRTDTEGINPVCATATGSIVALAQRLGGPRPQPGLRQTSGVLRLYSRDMKRSRDLDTLQFVPHWEAYTETSSGRFLLGSRVPFAPKLSIRCAGASVYWGNGSKSAVRRYVDGTVSDLPLEGLVTQAITQQMREAFADSLVSLHQQNERLRQLRIDPSQIRKRTEESIRARPYDHLPYYDDVRIGSDGSIWVLSSRLEGDSNTVWRGFHAGGASLGSVRLPASFQLMTVSDQTMWGIMRTSDSSQIRSYPR